jgi:hypothetical protein
MQKDLVSPWTHAYHGWRYIVVPITTSHPRSTKEQRINKKNSCYEERMIGIAEGGARTHDLEVDLFAVIRATRSTN